MASQSVAAAQDLPRTVGLPTVNSPVDNSGAARPLNAIADRIDHLMQGQQAALDRRAVAAARTAGAAAGEAKPGTMMEGGGELYQSAFNDAAAATAGRRLEIDARDRLDGLAREHATDPAAFNAKATAYRDGLLQGMPAEMRVQVAQNFDTLARPYSNQLQDNHRRAVAEQDLASFAEALPRRIAAVERLAGASLRDPAAVAALQQEEHGLLADLARMGPKQAFSLAGREFPADPARTGAMRVDQLAEQWLAVQQRATEATVLGGWRASGGSERWIDEWVRRERGEGTGGKGAMDPAQAPSGLPAQEVRRIEGLLRGEYARNKARMVEAQSAAWGALAGQVQANQAAVALTGREAQPITDDQLRAAGRTPQQIQQYRNQVAFGAATFEATNTLAMATPAELETFRPRLLPGGDLFGLHPEGAVRLAHAINTRAGQIAGSGLDARVADLRAQAIQAGTDGQAPPQLAPDEAAALRVPPERAAAINHDLVLQAEASRLTTRAALAPPSDAVDVPAGLTLTGPDAAENLTKAQAWHAAWAQRVASIEASPGNHVLNNDAPTRAAWGAAVSDLSRIGPAIAMTLNLQDRIGVPPGRQQAVPPAVAMTLAQAVTQLPTPAERLERLQGFLGQVPEEHRAQLTSALGAAGLPDGLRIGAAVAPRVGPLVASSLASELAVDVAKLHLVPSLAASVRNDATAVFDAETRLGGLRAAQAQVTGNAAFLEIAARERDMLERVAKVRAAPTGSIGTSEIRTAYTQLFGGSAVVNEDGYLLTVPAGMDATRVQRGLAGILAARLEGATAAQRAAAERGSWVDAGVDRYVFYPLASPTPLAARDGGPLVATPAEALAAPGGAMAQPRPRTAAEQRDRQEIDLLRARRAPPRVMDPTDTQDPRLQRLLAP